jgi:hypothetical protein
MRPGPFDLREVMSKELVDWLTSWFNYVAQPYVRWALRDDKPVAYIRIDFKLEKLENGTVTFSLMNEGMKDTPFGSFSD